MRLLLLVVLMFINVGLTYSQVDYDSKLLSKYEKAFLEEQVEHDQNFIIRQNFLVNESYLIVDRSEIDLSIEFKTLKNIDRFTKQESNVDWINFDLSNFNLYNYSYECTKERNYYLLGNTGKVLVILSQQEITREYNKTRQ
ncbi:MAG: hypothetical protein JXR60_06155 [Bacteroidales bacterium]|nr:hypothetical protein [Bacteroidales bacterium]